MHWANARESGNNDRNSHQKIILKTINGDGSNYIQKTVIPLCFMYIF